MTPDELTARVSRIEEALVSTHNSLALVSGLVADLFQEVARSGDTETAPEVEQCCDAPKLIPLMGGQVLCENCAATSARSQ